MAVIICQRYFIVHKRYSAHVQTFQPFSNRPKTRNMLRSMVRALPCTIRRSTRTSSVLTSSPQRLQPQAAATMVPFLWQESRRHSHGEPDIYAEEFDQGYVRRLQSPDIDNWEARRIMNELLGMDMIPEPEIVNAGLRAARTLNDYALAVRWLEGCRFKCGNEKKIYAWLMQEVRPTLEELGVSSVEEMGYACPELACESAHKF